jgi:hypothetical protein
MGANHILLVGAGFSRNWNAPLASEVASSLVQQFGNDRHIRDLLTQHSRNFENALSQIQREYLAAPSSSVAKDRLDRLQDAIGRMFSRLNSGFETKSNFEFSNDSQFSVRKYLSRFEAIFNLNQDLLLEMQYEDYVLLASGVRWNGVDRPGMKPVVDPSITGVGDKHRRRWTPEDPPFRLDSRLQPHFKLHGSSNWFTSGGDSLLVMGGNKDFMIRQHQVLQWYYETFRWYMSQPNTKLMVIGYSFSDKHINDLIVDGSRNGNLKGVFVVDPEGRGILNPTRHNPIRMHSDLDDVSDLGSSTRLISSTFGGDQFEHQKFIDFFAS